jgi:hypothetical protein
VETFASKHNGFGRLINVTLLPENWDCPVMSKSGRNELGITLQNMQVTPFSSVLKNRFIKQNKLLGQKFIVFLG